MYLLYYDANKIPFYLKEKIKLAYNKINSSDNKSMLDYMDNDLKVIIEVLK